jgi:hypothetical protein
MKSPAFRAFCLARPAQPHGPLSDKSQSPSGEPAKAEQQLATLEGICLIPCVETDDLKRAIAVFRAIVTR